MPVSPFRQERKRHNLFHTLLLIGGIFLLLCLIGALFAGLQGVIYAAGLALLLTLYGPSVSPTMLLRLFKAKKLPPAVAPHLYRGLESLALKAALPKNPTLYHIASESMNAFSVGTRGEAAIALTDGLLRNLPFRELMGVLAHEISHISNNDMRVMGIADVFSRLTSFFSTLGQVLLLVNLPLLLLGIIAVPWAAVLILLLAPYLSSLLQMGLSRTREYEADLDAVSLTGDARGLIQALKKIEEHNAGTGLLRRILSQGSGNLEPSLFRTHPVTAERIEKLRMLAEEQGESNPFADSAESTLPERLRPPEKPRRRTFSGLWY